MNGRHWAFGTILAIVGLWVYSALGEPGAGQPSSTPTSTSRPDCSALREGLIAWWSGDGDAKDATGKHDGTMVGKVEFAPGRFGQAFKLGEPGAYVGFCDHEDFHVANELTVALWICAKKIDGDRIILGKNHNAELMMTLNREGPVHMCHGRNGDPTWEHCQLGTSGGADHCTAAGATAIKARGAKAILKEGQWRHVVFVRTAKMLRWYVDGEFLNECENQVPVASVCNAPLALGRNGAMQLEPFIGLVDEVAMWKRALRPEEIRAVFTMPNLAAGPLWALAPAVERPTDADRVTLKDKTVLAGKIETASFTVTGAFGKVEVAAGGVAGLVHAGEAGVWVVLSDGQAILGKLADGDIRFRPREGGARSISASDWQECVFRQPEKADADTQGSGQPSWLTLRAGERVKWSGTLEAMQLKTAYGLVDLPGEEVVSIGQKADGLCSVGLANGTILSGTLPGKAFPVKLALGPVARIEAGQVAWLSRPGKPSETSELTKLLMKNGDCLLVDVKQETLTVRDAGKELNVVCGEISELTFSPAEARNVTLWVWGTRFISGKLMETTLSAELAGRPIQVPFAQVESLTQVAAAPAKVRKEIVRLVAQLGAESYRDRESATKSLIEMSKDILPLLKKYEANADAEVRTRLEKIMEALSPPKPPERQLPPDNIGFN